MKSKFWTNNSIEGHKYLTPWGWWMSDEVLAFITHSYTHTHTRVKQLGADGDAFSASESPKSMASWGPKNMSPRGKNRAKMWDDAALPQWSMNHVDTRIRVGFLPLGLPFLPPCRLAALHLDLTHFGGTLGPGYRVPGPGSRAQQTNNRTNQQNEVNKPPPPFSLLPMAQGSNPPTPMPPPPPKLLSKSQKHRDGSQNPQRSILRGRRQNQWWQRLKAHYQNDIVRADIDKDIP